jgi:hypothetical protein
VMDECPFLAHSCLDELSEIDRRARELASQAINSRGLAVSPS